MYKIVKNSLVNLAEEVEFSDRIQTGQCIGEGELI